MNDLRLAVPVCALLLGYLTGTTGAAERTAPTVTTGSASPLGTDHLTVNGSIHPHGLATSYYFEYGRTKDYGSKTAPKPLPPRLAAYYHESWDEGDGGWGSWGVKKLEHFREGGASGGFVRFTEPSGHDHNHDNGIGTVHLAKYLYTGAWGTLAKLPSAQLAAGDPDLRDARVSVWVRGKDWVPNGTELIWWTQSQSNPEVFNRPGLRHHNWAYTGHSLGDLLRSGKWEKAEYRLRNNADDWTYAGGERHYSYWPIDDAQAHLNLDFFHMVTFVDPKNPPHGSIDFDEFELAYRNYSLLLQSNGGKLVSAPPSPDDAATLSDGWRHGKGKMWRSAANPAGPLEFIWSFEDPVTIKTVQLHQNPDWPARDVEVLVSTDGTSYKTLLAKVLPEKGRPNANFAFTLDAGLSAKATHLKLRIVSGYRKEHWGLGEVEVFGTGATLLPDDDLYHVTADLLGLEAGATYHYRLVAASSAGTIRSEDRTFTLPADRKPWVLTGAALRITGTTAQLQGRLNPLGLPTRFWFEYGPTPEYGSKTAVSDGNKEFAPRLAFAPLSGLKPGTTYHYRLVAENDKGRSIGQDAVFTTTAK
jgi:hypothetical protein